MIKNYSVQEVAKLSGISKRTLHHYDSIGLFSPSRNESSHYRQYTDDDLHTLQQILFFKELGFKLAEIKEIIGMPDFDRLSAMRQHRNSLLKRRRQLSVLIKTIDKSIEHLSLNTEMKNPKELYEGLDKSFETTLRKEAMDSYGTGTIEQAELSLMKGGKERFTKLTADLNNIFRRLKNVEELNPDHEIVQDLISEHHNLIMKLWGVEDQSDLRLDAYRGLGETYVSDHRFKLIDDQHDPQFARFIQNAIMCFIESR